MTSAGSAGCPPCSLGGLRSQGGQCFQFYAVIVQELLSASCVLVCCPTLGAVLESKPC